MIPHELQQDAAERLADLHDIQRRVFTKILIFAALGAAVGWVLAS